MAYATRSDVEAIFGIANVAQWADLENTQDDEVIAARIAWALALAEGKMNDGLTGSCYAVPFTSVPVQVTEHTARMAGCLLYGSRGVSDVDDENRPVNLVSSHQRMVDMFIKSVKTGKTRLNGVDEAGSRYPQVRE